MSHYLGVVIMNLEDVGKRDILQSIKFLMAPYDENEGAGFEEVKCCEEPACEECHGSGTVLCDYNPLGQWDWYRVGGRWDGHVRGEKIISEDKGFNFDKKHEQLHHNMTTGKMFVRLIESGKTYMPFFIVTPDGEWQARDYYDYESDGCFIRPSDWDGKALSLLRKYADHFIVGIDAHN